MRQIRADRKPITFTPATSDKGIKYLRYSAYIPSATEPKDRSKDTRKQGQTSEFGHDIAAALDWWQSGGYGEAKVAKVKKARVAEAKAQPLSSAMTFQDFAQQWTDGSLHKKYQDHVKDKDHTRDEEVLRLHISPLIGKRPIDTITGDDCEKVLASLPKDMAVRTRRLVMQCLSKVLSYAVYPAKVITSTPMIRAMIPKAPKKDARAKSFLYPNEDKALLSCSAIPLARRIAYGVLMREGMRAGELSNLRWSDVDLDTGTISLDENKTDNPRTWKLSDDVARILTWWKKTNVRADDLVLGLSLSDGAWWLRGDAAYDPKQDESSTNNPGDLRRAGITRKQLWEDTRSRQPVRLHDLRGSFVTLHLAAGKTEAWITDRTGHQSSEMIYTYKRSARTASELDLGLPAAMDSVIPEYKATKQAKNSSGK